MQHCDSMLGLGRTCTGKYVGTRGSKSEFVTAHGTDGELWHRTRADGFANVRFTHTHTERPTLG